MPSLLDDHDNSTINRGLYDGIYILGLYFLFDLFYFHKIDFSSSQAYQSLKKDIYPLLIAWVIVSQLLNVIDNLICLLLIFHA